ncbi:MAG: Rod shape-determining protein RodA [Parcubacteria group bacterium GW2011_GWC1_41_7]|nr:MAG: Rod shape-determining protein RodA [Parcubacteria group bacterium GW2011_GWC1_41_7]
MKQFGFWIASFVILLSSMWVRYQNLMRPPYSIIFFSILGFFFVFNLLLPNKSWITVGPLSIQPSEFGRIALVMLLAMFFSKFSERLEGRGQFYVWLSLVSIAPLLFAVVIQPDMGMTVLYLLTWFFGLLNFISFKKFLSMCGIFLLLFVVMWFLVLKPYQKDRILAIAVPDRDPLGAGYNLTQMKIAVGSAGFLGKGFGQGTQARLGFLPEAHSDFLLASFLEEWGFLGFLIFSFTMCVFLVSVAKENSFFADHLSQSFGIIMLIQFAIRFTFTMAMNLGVAPIIGLPTPFFSYGGSHLLADALMLAVWNSGRV